jgi:hypothetical protein
MGTPGCFSVLSQTTLFWGKLIILLELGLCALAVGNEIFDICVLMSNI